MRRIRYINSLKIQRDIKKSFLTLSSIKIRNLGRAGGGVVPSSYKWSLPLSYQPNLKKAHLGFQKKFLVQLEANMQSTGHLR